MNSKKSLFRNKSIENISSPEKMDDYIHVTNTAGWMIIILILAILVALFTAAFMVRIDSKLAFYGIKEGSCIEVYVPDDLIETVRTQDSCVIDNVTCDVINIGNMPVQASEINGYVRELNSLSVDEWVYIIEIDGSELSDGIVKAEYIGDTVRPIDYLIN